MSGTRTAGIRSRVGQLFDLGSGDSDITLHALVARLLVGLAASSALASVLRSQIAWRGGALRYVLTMAVFVVVAVPILYVGTVRPALRRLRDRQAELVARHAAVRVESERHRFIAELQDAFDMIDTESEARDLVALTLPLVHAGPGELLLADSSRAHLTLAATSPDGGPGCGVPVPSLCPAVRRGHSTHFASSTALSSCPKLRDRGPGRAALCVPVTVLGTPMGVLHVTDREGSPDLLAERTRVESLAAQAGARIGSLRAASASQIAATTDPLTGPVNRRSTADDLQQLAVQGRSYAVAFVDLDCFKTLNDTFGHATGDHALRLFARTLMAAVRVGDITCRYGGEEFLVVFPDCDVTVAAPIVHRVREALVVATAAAAAGTPTFTASFGLADSTYADDPLDVIAIADAAVLEAKREGRDRLIIAERPGRPVSVEVSQELATRTARSLDAH